MHEPTETRARQKRKKLVRALWFSSTILPLLLRVSLELVYFVFITIINLIFINDDENETKKMHSLDLSMPLQSNAAYPYCVLPSLRRPLALILCVLRAGVVDRRFDRITNEWKNTFYFIKVFT